MAVHQFKGFLGWVGLKKIAGQATPAVGTEYTFPLASIQPRNPANITYPAVINKQGAPSVSVSGKKTPSITLTNIPLKTSWFTGSTGLNMINDFIGTAASLLDTNNNASSYSIGVNDGNATQVYDNCYCIQMSLYQTAPGGGILMDLGWLAQYGDSEASSPATFTTPSTDAGTLLDVTKVDYNSTADGVMNWRLTLMRPAAYTMYCDGTLYSDALQSGAFGGTFTLQQSSAAGTVPSTTATIKIGTTPNGISFVTNMIKDERVYDRAPTLLSFTNTYSLIKATAGYPITTATF